MKHTILIEQLWFLLRNWYDWTIYKSYVSNSKIVKPCRKIILSASKLDTKTLRKIRSIRSFMLRKSIGFNLGIEEEIKIEEVCTFKNWVWKKIPISRINWEIFNRWTLAPLLKANSKRILNLIILLKNN